MPNCESRGMILRSLTPTKRRRVREGNGILTLTPTPKPGPRAEVTKVRGRVKVRLERANPRGAVLKSTRMAFSAKALIVISPGSLKAQDTLTVTSLVYNVLFRWLAMSAFAMGATLGTYQTAITR